jgi:hypothetical protein
MKPLTTWLVGLGAAVFVVVVIAFAVVSWRSVGDTGISANGWIALVLGVLVTFAVGAGLMALVFISSRRGYDEPPAKDG